MKSAVAEAHAAIDEEASRIKARKQRLCGPSRSGTNQNESKSKLQQVELKRVKPKEPEKKPKEPEKENAPAVDVEERDAFSEVS